MRNIIIKSIIIGFTITALFSCKKWTEPQPISYGQSLTELTKDEEYYKALRAYKESDHSVAF
ncbi:MAG: glycoside hydrolase family 18, partial [Candidatus Cryptobacteroides sp.]